MTSNTYIIFTQKVSKRQIKVPAVRSNVKSSWKKERIWFLEGSHYNVHVIHFQQQQKYESCKDTIKNDPFTEKGGKEKLSPRKHTQDFVDKDFQWVQEAKEKETMPKKLKESLRIRSH